MNAISRRGAVSAPRDAQRLVKSKGPGRPLYSHILAGSIAAVVLFAQAPQLDAQCCGGGGATSGSNITLNDFKSLLSKRQSPKRLVVKIAPGEAHTLHLDNLTTGTTESVAIPANTALSSIVLPAPSDADVRVRMVHTATGGVSNRSTLVTQRSVSPSSDSGPTQSDSESSGESCSGGDFSAPIEESNMTTTSARSSKSSKPGDGRPTTVSPPPDEAFGIINPKFGAEVSKAFQNAAPCVRLEMNTGTGFSGRGAPKLVFQMPAANASQAPSRSMLKTSMLRGAGATIGGFAGNFHSDAGQTTGVVYTEAGLIREIRTMDVHAIVADLPNPADGFEVRFYKVTAAGGGFSGTILGSGSGGTPTTPTTPTGTYPPGNTDPQNGATPEVIWRFHSVGGYTVLSKISNGHTNDYKYSNNGPGTLYEELPESCPSSNYSAIWDSGDINSLPPGNVAIYRYGTRNGSSTSTIVNQGPDNVGPIFTPSPNQDVIDIITGDPEIPPNTPENPTPDPIPGTDDTVTTTASTGYYNIETVTPDAYAPVRDITILRPLPFGVVPNVDAAAATVANCDATIIHHEDTASGWSRDWTRKLAGVQVERHYATQTTAVHAFPPGGLPAQQVNVLTDMHFGSAASAAKVSVQKTISPLAADTRLAGLPVYRLGEDGTVTEFNYTFGIAGIRGEFDFTNDGTDVKTEATVYANGRTSKYVTIANDGETVFEESYRMQGGTSYLVSRVAHGYTNGFRTLSERATTTGWQPTYSAQSNGHFLDWEMGEDGVVTSYEDTDLTDAEHTPNRITRAAVPAANGRPGVPAQVRETGKDCYGWNWETTRETVAGPILSKRTWRVDAEGAIEEEVLNDWLHSRYVRTVNADLTQSVSIYQRKFGSAVGTERLISTRTTDREGRLLSVSGDAVVPETHAHSVTAAGWWKEVVTRGDATDNIVAERSWETHGTGRTESLPSGGANFRTYGFDAKGRVNSVTDAGTLVAQSAYNDATGAVTHTTLAAPDPSVVATQSTSIEESGGKTWEVSTTVKGTEVNTHKRRIGLLEPNVLSESISVSNGVATSFVVTRQEVTGGTAFEFVEATTPTGVATSYRYTKAGVEVARLSQVAGSSLDLVSIQTDAIGRALTTTHSANGTSTTNSYFAFNAFGGALQSSTSTGVDINWTPDAVSTATSFTYYDADNAAAGRVFSRTTDTMTTYFSHTARGQQRATWGATYPVRYTYDGAGRLKKMETYRDESALGAFAANANPEAWPAGDSTTWEYYPGKNLLKQKRDAANVGALYGYDNRGRMSTRTWARGVVTTYGYNTAGQMRTTTYSDGTPNVTMTYDAQGRVVTLTDGTGTRTFTYDAAGRRLGELYTAGRVDGLHFVHDDAGRQVGYALTDENGWATWQGWGYGNDGHQSGVMTPEGWVGYSYNPNSHWPQTRSFATYADSSALGSYLPVYVNAHAYSDGLGRLVRAETIGKNGSTLNTSLSRTYAYNEKGQRDRVTYETGDYWTYNYNARNEVTGGQKWYDNLAQDGNPDQWSNAAVGNSQHAYTFDAIGNRKTALTAFGQSTSIMSNALNQTVSRNLSYQAKFSGVANPLTTVSVSVNGAQKPTWRERDGAWMSYSTFISGAGKWSPVSVTEMLSGQPPTEKTGFKFMERILASTGTAPISLGYDLDGNQTIDPRWDHTWDAENRLIKSQLRQHVIDFNPTMPNERITYTYDAQWRRATKKVETRASATAPWVIQTHMRYAYEGWNLIAEWEIKTSPVKLTRTHHWGIDLSGTRSGAGGVGGLVMTRHHTLAGHNAVKSTIPAYDDGSNIIGYLDTADGKLVAEYEYGPFGEPLRETGPLAKAHPHRWSSKYTDEETGFSYYGYRYYVPQSGRWLSRDPIEEKGGLGLYSFVFNDANYWLDVWGNKGKSKGGGKYGVGDAARDIDTANGVHDAGGKLFDDDDDDKPEKPATQGQSCEPGEPDRFVKWPENCNVKQKAICWTISLFSRTVPGKKGCFGILHCTPKGPTGGYPQVGDTVHNEWVLEKKTCDPCLSNPEYRTGEWYDDGEVVK